jgi:hypothetical protein
VRADEQVADAQKAEHHGGVIQGGIHGIILIKLRQRSTEPCEPAGLVTPSKPQTAAQRQLKPAGARRQPSGFAASPAWGEHPMAFYFTILLFCGVASS